MRPLNLKGIPRWRRKQDTIFYLPERIHACEPHAAGALICQNIFRSLKCHACGLWTETAGMQTRQLAAALSNSWRNIKCNHCKRLRKANGWVCVCGVPWFRCAVHNASHLEGKSARHRDSHTDASPDAKRQRDAQAVIAAMPEPHVRAIRIRSRPTHAEPLTASLLTEQAPNRFRISLPPILQLRFPHLAE